MTTYRFTLRGETDPPPPVLLEAGLDDLAAVFTRARRRTIVDRLSTASSASVSRSDLARAITVAEYGRNYTAKQFNLVCITLRQTHLPTLARASVIEHDDERTTVRRGTNFDAACFVLRALETIER